MQCNTKHINSAAWNTYKQTTNLRNINNHRQPITFNTHLMPSQPYQPRAYYSHYTTYQSTIALTPISNNPHVHTTQPNGIDRWHRPLPELVRIAHCLLALTRL